MRLIEKIDGRFFKKLYLSQSDELSNEQKK